MRGCRAVAWWRSKSWLGWVAGEVVVVDRFGVGGVRSRGVLVFDCGLGGGVEWSVA